MIDISGVFTTIQRQWSLFSTTSEETEQPQKGPDEELMLHHDLNIIVSNPEAKHPTGCDNI